MLGLINRINETHIIRKCLIGERIVIDPVTRLFGQEPVYTRVLEEIEPPIPEPVVIPISGAFAVSGVNDFPEPYESQLSGIDEVDGESESPEPMTIRRHRPTKSLAKRREKQLIREQKKGRAK